ncbi:MAG: hypothetical protein PW786_13090 [Arachidicoccus sp.]|nr:hypothetical protein [Arachidicoccus sp.]
MAPATCLTEVQHAGLSSYCRARWDGSFLIVTSGSCLSPIHHLPSQGGQFRHHSHAQTVRSKQPSVIHERSAFLRCRLALQLPEASSRSLMMTTRRQSSD